MAENIDMSEEVETESSAEEKVQKRLVFPSLNQQSDGETEIVEHASMSDIRDKMIAWVKRMREDPSFKVVFKADENNVDHTNALTYAMKFAEASGRRSRFQFTEEDVFGSTSDKEVFFKIIVPNYNNMPYIKKCLDSILNQTFKDFMVIVVDDLSTDGSDEFCKEYAKKYSDKVVYIQLKEKGFAGAARNVGLDYPVKCKYILFVDSDDWLYASDVLSKIHHQIKSSNKDIKLIKLAMYNFFGNKDKRNYIKKFSSNLTVEEAFLKGCGPGRTCISAELARYKFKENRRIANDVIWSMRCIDRIDNSNLLSIQFPWAVYNRISVTSGTNTIKKFTSSAQYISQMKLLLSDLRQEIFSSDIVKKIQKKLIHQYSLQFEKADNIHSSKKKSSISGNIEQVFRDNIKYEYQKSSNKHNAINVLLVNFGSTTQFTISAISDLIVQTDNFDLTVIDNNSNAFHRTAKLLYESWTNHARSLHIIGLKKTVPLNSIWNAFHKMTTNPWLCFLNNDVGVPENFISDNNKVIDAVCSAGIINHATNNPKYKTNTDQLSYKIYDRKSNAFAHRQGWDFTINRDLYVDIPAEFTTFVGDNIQFNSVYVNNKDVVFVYSSPIIHYGSSSRKSNFNYFKQILEKERRIFSSSDKYRQYGNDKTYDFDKTLSHGQPKNISLLKQNIYGIKKNIVVSMTTCKSRIHNIPKVLKSILEQTVKPDTIIINLSNEEFQSIAEIPGNVLNFIIENDIEINWVDNDTKVYKKIIPILLKYQNDLVLSIDDDFIYPKSMIADFCQAYHRSPDQPISGNRIVKFGLNCHCGCASLVQYKFYSMYIENYLEYYKHCPSSDIFFTFIAHKNGYDYARTSNEYFNNMTSIHSSIGYSKQCKKRSIDMINDTYKWLKNNL